MAVVGKYEGEKSFNKNEIKFQMIELQSHLKSEEKFHIFRKVT